MQEKSSRNRLIICIGATAILVIGASLFILVLRAQPRKRSVGKDTKTKSTRIADLSQKQLCGPFSLHTAASMLGIQINFPELVKACKPSPKGVSMATLASVARKFGLDAKGYKMTWEKLLELQSPAILYVNPSHFVTVNPSKHLPDASPNNIRVFDSDKAPQWWSPTKMEDLWGGQTLVISQRARRRPFKGPRIEFDSLIHDLGDVRVPLEDKLNVSLVFINVGSKQLKVGRIKASCGCTKTAVSNEIVEPGQEGKINIAVDLNKARGPFNYAIVVESNDEVTPVAKARITGRAFNTELTARKELHLTATPRGGRTSKSLVLRDPGDGSLRDRGVQVLISPPTLSKDSEPMYVKAVCRPFDPNKHRVLRAKDSDLVVEIEVAVSESAPIGEFDGILEIITKIPSSEHIQIPIRGVVISNIAARPAALFYSDDKGEPISKTITIASRTGRVIDLQTISLPENLPLKVEKQNEEDKAIVLTATYSPSKREANTITGDIVCSFADETVLRIPVIIHSQQPH